MRWINFYVIRINRYTNKRWCGAICLGRVAIHGLEVLLIAHAIKFLGNETHFRYLNFGIHLKFRLNQSMSMQATQCCKIF